MRIEVVQGDIAALAVDAIVNAANPALAGGGGVDGAIHSAAGPALHAACKAIPMVAPFVRCPVGEARITPGFALPARYILHTVGPVWTGGRDGEPERLAACSGFVAQRLPLFLSEFSAQNDSFRRFTGL